MKCSFAARSAVAFASMAFVLLLGCTEGDRPTGSVTGKVTFNEAPLAAGDVNFLSKSGSAAIAKVDSNGNYKIDQLEAGEYQVYVTPPQAEPQAPGTKASAPPKFAIPAKFRDPATSGVTVTVKSGGNDIPVALKG